MSSERKERGANAAWQFWLPLAGALVLAPFANGANVVAVAAWLFPMFLLRAVRVRRPVIGLAIAYVVLTGAFAFQFRGMVPLPGIAFYPFLAAEGVVFLAPYAVDRWLAPRLSGLAASLVFPVAFSFVDYLASFSPFGSWCSIAYTQAGNLPVMQLASVTGLWGITFLMAFFAAGCNAVWENGWDRSRIPALTVTVVIAAVLLAGGIRLAVFAPDAPLVRIASLSAREAAPPPKTGPENLDALRQRMAPVNQNLLQRTEREMQAGARIVFWAEGNATVMKGDESAFVTQGAALARRNHAWLGMAMAVLHGGTPSHFENVLVLLAPDGRVSWVYNKARPVPGPEAALTIPGDRRMKVATTGYGRLAGIICFDGDFPRVVAQAGTLGADILLDPSNDWRAVDPIHTDMAGFRAVEQGVNLIRQTSHGLSAAYDYQGRVLARMDHFQSHDLTLVAQVPTRGAPTFYACFGDWFAWLAGLGLLALIGTAQVIRRRQM